MNRLFPLFAAMAVACAATSSYAKDLRGDVTAVPALEARSAAPKTSARPCPSNQPSPAKSLRARAVASGAYASFLIGAFLALVGGATMATVPDRRRAREGAWLAAIGSTAQIAAIATLAATLA